MSCGIHSGCKMVISLHQCMRNSFNINKEVFLCRRFNTLKRALKPVSLIKFSHHSVKDRAIRYGLNGSNVFFKKHQFVVPLACKFFSHDSSKLVPDDKKSETKVSLYQRLKKMYKEYWYVLVPVHILTSCIWFGGFYYVAASGLDIPVLLENLGAPESWVENFKKSKAGNVVLAYTLYKVATPLRYTVTIGGTTLSINYLKKWGWIKPVPTKAAIKKIYQEQKGVLKDLKASYKDKMQVTKSEILKTKYKMEKELKTAKDDFHDVMSSTRHDFREGVSQGAEEWKVIARSFRNDFNKVVEGFKKKRSD